PRTLPRDRGAARGRALPHPGGLASTSSRADARAIRPRAGVLLFGPEGHGGHPDWRDTELDPAGSLRASGVLPQPRVHAQVSEGAARAAGAGAGQAAQDLILSVPEGDGILTRNPQLHEDAQRASADHGADARVDHRPIIHTA